MALDFNQATPDYLNLDGTPPITGYPFAVTGWVNSDSAALAQAAFFIGDKDVSNKYAALYLRGDAGDVARMFIYSHGAGDSAIADTTNTYSVSTAHHLAGVCLATGIYCYLDGDVANKGADTVGVPTPDSWDRMRIGYLGDLTPTHAFAGRIAEVALYDLTDWGANDAARLAEFERQLPGMAARMHPQFFGPGRTSCWALGGLNGEHYRDIWGDYDMSASGAPAWADHPGGLIYPSDGLVVPAAPAAPAAGGPGSYILGGGICV